ncbi:MAG: ribosome-associated translation inhibitor RaiA [Lachnospiraceae bacterium]|nr:ribosome-associated translation inhibitor RaiA [Lachnospiraceae bacterium]MBR3036969.1 ribosome-associated translation inhibitor RaiA [Lachnospiraceae bacterium]
MKYVFNGRNYSITDDVRSYAEKKFGKFDNYFTENTEIHITLSKTRGEEKAEITIPMKGTTVRAEQSSNDMFTAIDLLQEIVERQLRRNRKKLIDRKQNAPSLSSYFAEFEDDEDVEEDTIRIVKSKRFALKPMDPEEACFQMDMSNHNFYVFYNSETDQVNVVYKRRDGDYGLIEPEY